MGAISLKLNKESDLNAARISHKSVKKVNLLGLKGRKLDKDQIHI